LVPDRLRRSFFARPTLVVAEALIGKVLVHRTPDGTTAGAIVETEAYIGEDDPACHAAPGPTRRNEPLYGAPGVFYVYLNYGMHFLVNLVTEGKGAPAAVLLRALDPLDGLDLMARRRGATKSRAIARTDLCRGPGNLTRALGITLAHNRLNVSDPNLFLEDRGIDPGPLAWSPRIGIRVGVEHEWRCYALGSSAVSGGRRLRR
jgi:DNA-3-methyladenine glycosylase